MECSIPGLPVPHQLPEFAQTHVHWVRDAFQPSHPLLSPSPAFNLPQHQGLFKWVSSLQKSGQSIGVSASASVLQMNIQDWFPVGLTDLIFFQSNGLSRVLYRATILLFIVQYLLTYRIFGWSLRPYIISRHSDFICGSFRNWSSILKFMFCMPEISKTSLTY